jgi:hypothetical protein
MTQTFLRLNKRWVSIIEHNATGQASRDTTTVAATYTGGFHMAKDIESNLV